MTRAPQNLLTVRNLLLTHLNIDKNATRDADLESAEVGIVGDVNHRGGYHCGSDRVTSNDYSVYESSRDRNGLTQDAAALDVGQFKIVKNGRTHDLRSFSVWCVNECQRKAPDTGDIREIIYSPDGRTVRRWDALGRRTTGDNSHLSHTHFSFFRDAIKAGRDQTSLFRRYLQSTGIATGGVEDLFASYGDEGPHVRYLQYRLSNLTPTIKALVGTVDGSYGPKTAAGVAAMVELHNGNKVDGKTYGPVEMIYLDVQWVKRWAPAAQPVDLRPVEARLKALEDRPAGSLPDSIKVSGTLSVQAT